MSQVDLSIGPPGQPEVELDADELEHELNLDDNTPAELLEVPHITETQVRDLLDGAGRAASIPPLDMGVRNVWRFEAEELDSIVPPLTRIINRRPQLARAVARGDELVVALAFARYLGVRGDQISEHRKATNGDGEREADGAAQRDVATVGGPGFGAASIHPVRGGGAEPHG